MNNVKEKNTDIWEDSYYKLADGSMLHSNKSTSGRVLGYLSKTLKSGDSILDVGCGLAGLSNSIKDDVYYIGVDSSEHAIKNTKARTKNVALHKGEADSLPFENDSLDVVVSIYSLEHFSNPKGALDEMVRVLKPEGSLIIAAPNLELPFSYPSAFRHKSFFYRLGYYVKRIGDYIVRLFGGYVFRTTKDNYLDATGKYEKPDDDLVYLTSSYEVISYLKKKHHLVSVFENKMSNRTGLRGAITFLPRMKYYGDILFVIMLNKIL